MTSAHINLANIEILFFLLEFILVFPPSMLNFLKKFKQLRLILLLLRKPSEFPTNSRPTKPTLTNTRSDSWTHNGPPRLQDPVSSHRKQRPESGTTPLWQRVKVEWAAVAQSPALSFVNFFLPQLMVLLSELSFFFRF